jgi:undecaprenyl-diphosphatase
VKAHPQSDLDRFALAVTWLAGWPGTAVVLGVLVAAFLVRRRYLDAAGLLVAVLGAWALELVLKPVFAIARPEVFPHLTHAGGFSFPSGHALRGTAMFGFLAGLLVVSRPAVWRWLLALACAAVAVAICWSRVYLGVHWPTDVTAGAVASAGWVTACLTARHYAMTRPRKK